MTFLESIEKIQRKLDELEFIGFFERVGLNAARNNELGSKHINPIIVLPNVDT